MESLSCEKPPYQVNSQAGVESGIIADAILEFIRESMATKPRPTRLCIIDTSRRDTELEGDDKVITIILSA
jgi:hypothetical protein